MGCGDYVFSILTQFLSNGSQHVMVDGCQSELVNVVAEVLRQCFRPVIVPPVHFRAFSILENKPIGYVDDSTMMVVVPSPGIIVTVAMPPICDLGIVSEWCDL